MRTMMLKVLLTLAFLLPGCALVSAPQGPLKTIYHPGSEISLAWDDPALGVEWPLPAGERPQLSDKDSRGLAWAEVPLLG